MVIQRIPKTNIRPKYLIKVYSINVNQPIPLLNDSTKNLADIIKEYSYGNPIGVVQSIEINSSRTNSFYRELNFDTIGKIKETYPGLSKYSGKVSKIALYKEHLLDAFKAVEKDVFTGDTSTDALSASFNIYNQISPLIIKFDLLEPKVNSENGAWEPTGSTTSIVLWDVWFKNSIIEFSIEEETDLAIIQESDISFAWLVAY